MRNKHYIYLIEDYQWKNGSIGKVGVTQNPERRAKEYKLESLTILEEHTNAKVASKREIELQKQYGFKVDTREYWKTLKWQKKTSTKKARKKAVANTDYKAIAKKVDYKARNIDYKARNMKVNWKAKAAKCKKPINQYDLEGNFIKQWDSATDISLFLGVINGTNITACCKGRLNHAYKFKWKYAN
jgi:hypothetical protein